jgi:hypothetical protein
VGKVLRVEPRVEAARPGPPRRVEAFVGFLIPSDCREVVLGDLRERYTSFRCYLIDVLFVLPHLIASRIRRTSDLRLFLTEALALYGAFLGVAYQLEGARFLNHKWSVLRLTIPTVAVLMGLALVDAYDSTGVRSLRKILLEVTLCVGFASLVELALSAVDRELVLTRPILLYAGILSVALVAALRIMFPEDAGRFRGA